MKFFRFVPAFLCILLLKTENSNAQVRTETSLLRNASIQRTKENEINFKKLLELSKVKGWPLMINRKNGEAAKLLDVDPFGYPIYVSVDDNLRAAATIRTNLLWPGGSTGLSLSGSLINLKGKIGLWDGGRVRGTHVELTGRVLQKDNPASLSDHATHVAGVMIGAGVNPLAKGMAYGAQQLLAYDFNNDEAGQMLGIASELLISNHSYSAITGWFLSTTDNRWEFYGRANENEDYKFGYYSQTSMLFDSIAYNAPFYLIVTAAGNNRNLNGPAVGAPYWRYNANGQMANAGNRPAGISSNDGYDIIGDRALAKNVLAVGSIAAIPAGFAVAGDAVLSRFSSWGPTDDGRIKPDVVANGENLLSSFSTSDNAYGILSGTSFSSPSAAGSIFLLQEYYAKLHAGAFLRSASLKGLVIHTADDAGAVGPDYQYGWGVINMERAASVITANNSNHLILENQLANGGNFNQTVVASGKGPLTVTLSWTDPRGTVETVNTLNNPAKKLVNDLDVRVRKGTDTYLPFTLNPTVPSALAIRGDNVTDNVEKIIIDNTVPGESYTITVTHKNTLQRGQQAYSLIVSNVGSTAYCSSAATSTAGARIDSVGLGSTGFGNAAGCTSYSNKTANIFTIEPNQTLPLTVRVSSCDATSAAKIVKVFIDYNNDGDFVDAGESVAQSGVLNGATTYTGSIVTPTNLTTGNLLLMRIIVQETSTGTDVNACGSYTRGETQDFSLRVGTPSSDLGVSEIVSPDVSLCASNMQYIAVRIKNFGSASKVNFPVTAVIKNGATTLATLNAVCPDTVAAQSSVVYTFQTPFTAVAGTTYTITANTGLTTDQNLLNNSFTSNAIVSAVSAPPAATAEICGTTSASLKTTASSSDLVNWYASATATTPIATGPSATTTTVTSNKTYYLSLNEVNGKTGLPTRTTGTTSGGYSNLAPLVNFTNSVPLTIETMRLYVGNAGKVTIILADNVTTTSSGFTYIATASSTIDLYPTAPSPTGADTGQIFTINLPVNAVGTHALFIQFSGGATLYRNNGGFTTNPYPITLPGIMSITGNNQTNPTDFYYYYYDIGVKLANCATSRAAVVATTTNAPTATLAGNLITSSYATGNQWYLNGTVISTATGQTYTATTSGLYKTVVTTPSGCVMSSNEVNFSTTPVVDVNGTGIALIASPNPNKGQFYLQFDVKGKDDLSISLLNSLGQKVYSSMYPGFSGRFAQQIKPNGKIDPGMYLLKIEHNKKVYLKKLLVQ